MTVIYKSPPASTVIEKAVKILNETRKNSVADEKRCEWLYLRNPDGEATLWVALVGDKHVGFSALIPRRFWVKGELKSACTTADLSVLSNFRRQGIASKLRLEAKKLIEEGRFDFLYGHPNIKSQGAHQKAGFYQIGSMIRRLKILDTSPQWEKLIGDSPLNKLFSGVSNKLLPFVFTPPKKHFETEWISWLQVDERFDRLDEEHKNQRPVQGVRDARYLKWRYGLNPVDSFRMVVAKKNDDIKGFCIVRPIKESLEIVDIFPPNNQDVAETLLAAVHDNAKLDGISALSATWMTRHPAEYLLKKFGFVSRGDISIMHALHSPALGNLSSRPSDWLISAGDRDI